MNQNKYLNKTKRIGTGLALILFPVIFIFAFSGHPDLLSPHMLGPQEMILRAHQNSLLQFGHALVTLATGLLVVVALYIKNMLDRTNSAWAGFIGAALAILGALALAADKGALCLTMSALDTLPESEFVRMMPGLLAMFSKQGWLVLLWGMVFLPIGFGIQAVALLKTGVLPRWQSAIFLIGVLFIATPDGLEIINLTASILLAIVFIPYGVQLIRCAFKGKKMKVRVCPRNCAECFNEKQRISLQEP